MKSISRFVRDDQGVGKLEYALVAGLIAVAAVIVYATGWAHELATSIDNAINTNAS